MNSKKKVKQATLILPEIWIPQISPSATFLCHFSAGGGLGGDEKNISVRSCNISFWHIAFRFRPATLLYFRSVRNNIILFLVCRDVQFVVSVRLASKSASRTEVVARQGKSMWTKRWRGIITAESIIQGWVLGMKVCFFCLLTLWFTLLVRSLYIYSEYNRKNL